MLEMFQVFGYELSLKTHEKKCSSKTNTSNKDKVREVEYKLLRKHAEDVHNTKLKNEEHRFQSLLNGMFH